MKQNLLLTIACVSLSLLNQPAKADITLTGGAAYQPDCVAGYALLSVMGDPSGAALIVDGGSRLTNFNNPCGLSGFILRVGGSGSSNNSVLVSGVGSYLKTIPHTQFGPFGSMGNHITISDGAELEGGVGFGGTANVLLVTDLGSYVTGDIGIGGIGVAGNQITLQNGARIDGNLSVGNDSTNLSTTVLVSGTNTLWNAPNSLFLGGTNCYLTINKGALMNGGGISGQGSILVDGSGTSLNVSGISGFSDSSQFTVSGGATANFGYIYFGGVNHVVITDPGSSVNFFGGLSLVAVSNQMTISNSAKVTVLGDIDFGEGGVIGQSNSLIVAGASSQLVVPADTIIVGGKPPYPSGSDNQLIVTAGGLIVTANLTIEAGNSVTVAGSLYVTNSSGSGKLTNGGTLTISGAVLADMVSLEGTVNFPTGTFMAKGLGGDNGLIFVVGDGTNMANYVMQGGTHSFVNGLVISSNSVLSGCGTVTGSVTNYGLIILTNGCDMNFTGPVINYGTILALNGLADFQSTFVNNGTLFQNTARVTGLSFSGTNVVVQFNTVSNYLHDVQARTDLASGAWTLLTNGLLGTGSLMTITDYGGATNGQRFYRVLLHY